VRLRSDGLIYFVDLKLCIGIFYISMLSGALLFGVDIDTGRS
jgi:hypothetical protein